MTQFTSKRSFHQRGLTLAELSIALALIASLIIGGFYAIKRIQTDKGLNAMLADVPATMNAAVAAYSTVNTTAGANPQILSAMKVWPSERMVGAGTAGVRINGHFSGSREYIWTNPLAIAGGGAGGILINQGFTYHITGIPAEVCMPLVRAVASNPNVVGVWAGNRAAAEPIGNNNGGGLVNVKALATSALRMQATSVECAGSNLKSVAIVFYRA